MEFNYGRVITEDVPGHHYYYAAIVIFYALSTITSDRVRDYLDFYGLPAESIYSPFFKYGWWNI